jgi:hypothetical protein
MRLGPSRYTGCLNAEMPSVCSIQFSLYWLYYFYRKKIEDYFSSSMHSKSWRKLKSSSCRNDIPQRDPLSGFRWRIDFTSRRKTSLQLIFSAHLVYDSDSSRTSTFTYLCIVHRYQIEATPKNNVKLTKRKRPRAIETLITIKNREDTSN